MPNAECPRYMGRAEFREDLSQAADPAMLGALRGNARLGMFHASSIYSSNAATTEHPHGADRSFTGTGMAEVPADM